MMSMFRCVNSGGRMCSTLASDPVSRLSTQITRCPRASSSSHRCEPRKPAPPVTKQVDTQAAYCFSRIFRLPTILLDVSATAQHLTVAAIAGPDDPRRFTDSGIEIDELYTE